jgi:hypothetical protein
VFNKEMSLENGSIKKKIDEVLKTDPKSNIEAMSSFIKTLEDEFEREKKIAEQRRLMNELFDNQTAERRNKAKAEL